MKFCTKCGWEIKDDQSFCPNCGTAVGEQPSSYQQPAPTNSTYYVDTQPIKIGKTKRIIITILLALALVGILSNAFDCFEVATVLSDGGVSAVKQLLEDNPSLEMNFNGINVEELTDTEIAQFAEIMRIIMIAFGVCCLVPLCWVLPMGIKILKAMKEGTTLKSGFKVCTLLFVNLIVGIILLCSSDI